MTDSMLPFSSKVTTPLLLAERLGTAMSPVGCSTLRSAGKSIREVVTVWIKSPSLSHRWIWPGPRLPMYAGESAVIGESCRAVVGYVPFTHESVAPIVSFSGPILSRQVIGPTLHEELDGVQLHGRLWADVDDDGAFTIHDRGVAGLEVQVLDGGGAIVASVTTTNAGLYSFANLEPHTNYEFRLAEPDLALAGARVMGESRTDAWATMWFRTGSPGLTIWGTDFQLAG